MLIQQEQQQQQVPIAGSVIGKTVAKSNADDTNAADNVSQSSADNTPRSQKFLSILNYVQLFYVSSLIPQVNLK